MPLRGEQANLGALVLEQSVGRDGRAVDDASALPRALPAISERQSLREAAQTLHDARRIRSPGVDAALAMVTPPFSSTATRSVKVPPTSMPMRYMREPQGETKPSSTSRVRAAEERSRGSPQTAAAARVNVQNIARVQRDPGLLGLERPIGAAARLHPVVVRLAVETADQAAGAVLDAVAGRVADRRLLRFDRHFELRARPAAIAAVAAAVGAELMAPEEQRKAHLVHLDAAELDAARRLPLAGGRPAVAGRGGAAAWPRLEQMPDERLGCARVDALDGDAEAPPPAGHGALRTSRRQRADDRLDDLLAAVIGAQRDRRAGARPHDGAFLQFDVERTERAIVLRSVRIDQVGQRNHDGRMRIGERRVDEAHNLGMACR